MKSLLKTQNMYQFYKNYIEDLNKQMLPYPKKKRYEIIKEVQSYIYEELLNQKRNGEEVNSLNAINKLYGSVSITAEMDIVENKSSIFRFLLICAKYIIWTGLIIIFLLALLKLFYPDQTGLFYDENQFVGLGYMNFSGYNLEDKLGPWFFAFLSTPALFFMFLLYLLTIRRYMYPKEYNKLILEALNGYPSKMKPE